MEQTKRTEANKRENAENAHRVCLAMYNAIVHVQTLHHC